MSTISWIDDGDPFESTVQVYQLLQWREMQSFILSVVIIFLVQITRQFW